MKLFVIAIVFVSVSIVFADDVVWRIARPFSLMPGNSGPEGSETAKKQMSQNVKEEAKPKNDQEHTKSAPLNADNNAPNDQDSGHESQRHVDQNEQAPPIWYAHPLTVFLLAIIGLGLTGYGVHLAWYQVFYAKKADVRDEQNVLTAADASLVNRMKERAYISVERWRMTNEYKLGPYTLACELHNTGRTPATLGDYDIRTDLRKDLPPLLNYEELSRTDLKGIVLGASDCHTLQAPDPICQFARQVVEGILDPVFAAMKLPPRRKEEILTAAQRSTPMPTEEFDRVLDTRAVTLYVYGCIAYTDEFDSLHRVAFCTRYDPKQEIFLLVTDREYNYST